MTALAPLAAETVRAKSRLNLRQEPTTDSGRIALLPSGADLEVISRRGLWIRVRSDAGEGWVHSEFVVSTDLLDQSSPERTLRDAELARAVALLRVEQLEKELATLRRREPSDLAELRAQLEQRDRQVAELVDEIATTSAQGGDDAGISARLDAVSGERDGLAGQVTDLESQIATLRAALTTAQAGAVRETTGITPEDLAAVAAERDRAVEQASRLVGELEVARQGLAEAGRNSVRREDELREERGDLAAAAEGFEEDLKAARQALAEQAETTAALEQRASAGDVARRSLETRAAEVETISVERDRLKAGIAALELELTGAQSTLAERDTALEASVTQLARERTDLQSRLASLETQLSQREADLKAASGATAEDESTIATLRQQLANRETGSSQLAGSLEAARQALSGREQEVDALEARVAKLVADTAAERESSRSRLQVAESKSAEDESTIATLRQQLASRETGSSQLLGSLDETRQALVGREQEIGVLEARVAKLVADTAAERESSRSRLQTAESAKAEDESTIATLRQQLASRETGTSQLSGSLDETRRALLSREQEIDVLEARVVKLAADTTAEREVSKGELQAAESTTARLGRRTEELEEALRQRDAQIATLEQAAPSEDGAAALRSQLTSMRQDRGSLEAQVAGLEAELSAARATSAQKGEEVDAYAFEARRLADALDELQDWSAKAEVVVERLTADNSDLAGQIAALKERRNRRAEPVRRELEVARSQAAAAEKSAEELTRELELAQSKQTEAQSAARAELGDQLAVAWAEKAAVEAALETTRSAVELADSAAAEATRQAQALQGRLTQAEEREQSASAARTTALSELEAAAQRADGLRAEVERLSEVDAGLRARVSELETEVRNAAVEEAEVARLSKVENELRAQVTVLEASAADSTSQRSEIARLSRLTQGLRTKVSGLEDEAKLAAGQRDEMARLSDVEAAKAVDLRAEMEQTSRSEQGLRSRVRELEAQLETGVERASSRDGEVERLSMVEETLRARVVELEESLAGVQRQSAETARSSETEQRLADRVRDLETQVADGAVWRQRAEASARELAAVRRETASTKADLEAARIARARPLVRPASPVAQPENDGDATARAQNEEPRERLVAPSASIASTTPDPSAQSGAAGPGAVETAMRWADAWARQDVAAYLGFYDARFSPAGGMAREAWATQRSQRLAAPAFIEVELRDLKVLSTGAAGAIVSFEQRYRSDSFSDRVRKSLELVKQGDRWKIVSETTE